MSDEQHLQDKPSVLLSSEFLWILSFYSQENFIKLQITGKFLTLSTSISLEKSKPCWSLEGKELSRCKKWNDGWRAAQHQRKIHWPLFEPRLDKASVSQFSEPLVQSSGFKVWKEKSKSSTSLGKLIEKIKAHLPVFPFHGNPIWRFVEQRMVPYWSHLRSGSSPTTLHSVVCCHAFLWLFSFI